MSEEKEKKAEEPGLSARMLESRTIIISGAVDSKLAERVIQQLVILDQDDSKKPVTVMVNSPGGEVFSGFAIFDAIRFINAPVRTVVMGLAASMGSIIPLAAPAGQRFSLPNAKYLIHQPLLMGYQGPATDLEIQAREILKDRERIIDLYADITGKKKEVIAKDIERDNWMSAKEALSYKLVDKIITSRSELDK